jgi:hypothetical protein
MNQAPIFIVGVPRSGTTLLAAMLAAHSRMSCGPETHFFRYLSKIDPGSLCDKETWPGPAIDFLYSVTYPSFSESERKNLVDKYEVERQQVEEYLTAREPLISNILSSVTEQYMRTMAKVRWVEKTPDHIKHVDLIRKYFPESPIIRIQRDPRDVAVSLTKVPWGAPSFPRALLFWKKFVEASEKFFCTDRNSYTLRYEDLISSPVKELQRLCQFIGEDFEETMLDTSFTGKQVNTQNVPWKEKASQPIDVSRISIWRNVLTNQENQFAEAFIGDHLEKYGYPRQESFRQLGEIYPKFLLVAKYATALEVVTSKGIRFWKKDQAEKPAVTIYLGDPGDDQWLGDKKSERIANLLSLSARMVKSWLTDHTVFWVSETSEDKWSGYFDYLIRRLLMPYKVSLDEAAQRT